MFGGRSQVNISRCYPPAPPPGAAAQEGLTEICCHVVFVKEREALGGLLVNICRQCLPEGKGGWGGVDPLLPQPI